MQIPDRYRSLTIAGIPLLQGIMDSGGHPLDWPPVDSYPPPGFLPYSFSEYGNGDVDGFYWPIGRENEEPVICTTYHDEWGMEPVASNLEGFIRLEAASGRWDTDDEEHGFAQEIADQLGFSLPETSNDSGLPARVRLELDAHSPSALRDAAAEAVKEGNFDLAQAHLHTSLTILPEYTAALYDMAVLRRRQGQMPEAAQAMLGVLGSPLCFGGDREKCLQWLQRLPDDGFPDLTADPFWQSRHRLTFATGVNSLSQKS